jgi:hypothetical protein
MSSASPPVVEHEDHVGGTDRREPVGDRDRGPVVHDGFKCSLDDPLALGVERRGGLVEHQHARVLEDHTRDREALALPTGEAVSPLADDRVIALIELEDAVMDESRACRLLDLCLDRVGTPETPVAGTRPDGPAGRACSS